MRSEGEPAVQALLETVGDSTVALPSTTAEGGTKHAKTVLSNNADLH